MRSRPAALAAVVAALVLGGAVGAPPEAFAQDPYYISVGGGIYDFNKTQVGQGRLELRFADSFLFLKPMLGVMVTTDKAVYGYGGLRLDLYLGQHWVVTPNAAFGAYYRGDGIRLGSTLEFKTGAEFDYRFDDHSRIGVAIDHISNAGITKQNPGANTALVYYSFPFGPVGGEHVAQRRQSRAAIDAPGVNAAEE